MSWFSGMLGTAGFLADLAGQIGNVVAQQQIVSNQREQLRIYQQAVGKQLELEQRAQDLNYDLSARGPLLRYTNARQAGFTHDEALQLGTNHNVIYGGVSVDPRPLQSLPYYNQGSQLRQQATTVASSFRVGTPGFTKPQPAGFANPNYQPMLIGFRQNLDFNPGSSSV
ncbi:minor structural protein [Sapovirus GX/HgTa3-2]|nr:minor structural protein [Sapovirus GX/HgTa3-2]